MGIQKVAVIFDDWLRPDTTGVHCRKALRELVGVMHFHPDRIARSPHGLRPGEGSEDRREAGSGDPGCGLERRDHAPAGWSSHAADDRKSVMLAPVGIQPVHYQVTTPSSRVRTGWCSARSVNYHTASNQAFARGAGRHECFARPDRQGRSRAWRVKRLGHGDGCRPWIERHHCQEFVDIAARHARVVDPIRGASKGREAEGACSSSYQYKPATRLPCRCNHPGGLR